MYAGGMSYFSNGSFGSSSHVAVCPETAARALSETSQINAGAPGIVEYFMSGQVNWVVEALNC